jgi:hypothetical protein
MVALRVKEDTPTPLGKQGENKPLPSTISLLVA